MEAKICPNLSTQELIDEVEKTPVAEQKAQNLSAKEAFLAIAGSLAVIRQHAERLLRIVLPQVFDFLEVAHGHPDFFGMASDLPGKTWGEVVGQLEAGVDKLKSSANPAMKRAVHLALLLFRLNPEMDKAGAEEALAWAVREKYLRPDFGVSDQFGFTPGDKKDLGRILVALRAKGAIISQPKSVEPSVQVSIVSLKAQTANQVICARDAWNGAVGKFKLTIPANGKREGTLELESQPGGFLFVVKATNGYADLESQAINLYAIRDDDGNIRDSLKLIPSMLDSEKLAQWQTRMERLGGALQKGFARVFEEETRTVSPEAFLGNEAVGYVNLLYCGDFNWDPPHGGQKSTIVDLYLKFARRSDGQIGLVSIANTDPQARALFGLAIGKFSSPGKAFSALEPIQCRVFLRAVFGQVIQKRV